MVSQKFVSKVAERDPILAERFQDEERPPAHRPMWPRNHLKKTRTASPEEAELLDSKTSF